MERVKKMIAYRNHAEALREMVADFASAESQKMLQRLADEYDRMADKLEESLRDRPLVF